VARDQGCKGVSTIISRVCKISEVSGRILGAATPASREEVNRMPKGKPWTVELEKQLRELVESGKSAAKIAVVLEKSYASVSSKIKRLGLRVEDDDGLSGSLLSSTLVLPKDLPSVEEALLKVAAAMKALEKPGLSKTEIMRLRTLIQTSGLYQKRFVEYVNYRQIEAKVDKALEFLEKRVQDRAEVQNRQDRG